MLLPSYLKPFTRLNGFYLYLSLCLAFPQYVSAQVELNLLNCQQCIYEIHDGELGEWQINWRADFKPKTKFTFNYHSLAIGKIRLGSDTVLKTYLIHNYQSTGLNYWDGKKWRYRSLGTFEGAIIGMGAGNFDFYYLTTQQGLVRVYYFDGYNSRLLGFNFEARTADIAVDGAGRAWFASSNNGETVNQFTVMNREGDILHKYPIETPFDPNNIYGITIEEDIIYLGVGPGGETFTSSLLAFKIENGRAKLLERMPQAQVDQIYYDLASGNPAVPGRKTTTEDNPFGVYVYPNPCDGLYKIYSRVPAPIQLQIFDLRGRLMYTQRLLPGEEFDIRHLASGAYLYRISVYGGLSSGRIIKR